jgi:hypothetical protein
MKEADEGGVTARVKVDCRWKSSWLTTSDGAVKQA